MHQKQKIKEALGVPEILHYDKYLGLPSFIDRHTKKKKKKKKQVLITSKKKCGGNYRIGKRSYCHKQVEKF